MNDKPLEQMNFDELSTLMVENDKQIINQIDLLDTVEIEKHNVEVKLMGIKESIRMCKKSISKMILEKEILERIYGANKRG